MGSQQQRQQHYSYQNQEAGATPSAVPQNTNNASSCFDANTTKNGSAGHEDDDVSHDGDDDKNDDSDSDGEFDYLLDDDDDDAVLEAIRQKRLREMKKSHEIVAEQKSRGHGEVRTISQDEFLGECTSSKYVVVHFFHEEFEKCKVMDHHLKILASDPSHLSCKFVRIDAEKAPFFVVRLKIKTLPTVILFKDGKTTEKLLGFEGLTTVSSSRSSVVDNENFPTSRLGYWLESLGAIEYDGPDSDDEINNNNNNKTRRSTPHGRNRNGVYDEDL